MQLSKAIETLISKVEYDDSCFVDSTEISTLNKLLNTLIVFNTSQQELIKDIRTLLCEGDFLACVFHYLSNNGPDADVLKCLAIIFKEIGENS